MNNILTNFVSEYALKKVKLKCEKYNIVTLQLAVGTQNYSP